MSSMIYDAILIVLISIFTALLGEGECEKKETGLRRVSSDRHLLMFAFFFVISRSDMVIGLPD